MSDLTSSAAKSLLSSILAFQRQTVELVSGPVREIPEGWVARTPAMRAVWWLNQVRVTGPTTYEDAVALARRHMDGAGYHQLYLDHEPSGRRLADVFRADGWEVDVELHMGLVGEPDGVADADGVVEAGEEEALGLMERWLREDKTLRLTRSELDQLIEANRLTWRARHAVRLGVREAGGPLVAVTLLFSDGRTAQVEDVYVIPEARGRGYGRALVTRAVALARAGGHELTFIVADDNDWPKHLYRRAGFEPAGRTWMFHRPRPARAG